MRRTAARGTSDTARTALTALPVIGALPAVTALAIIALPVIAALAAILVAPPASARTGRPAQVPGDCHASKPWDQPCEGSRKTWPSSASGGGTGTSAGLSVTAGGLTPCPSGSHVSAGGSLTPWVPGPCPVSAARPKPKPKPATRPASSRPRPPAQKIVPQGPASPAMPAAVVTSAAPASRPHKPHPRPDKSHQIPSPAAFRPALEGLPAATYTPGRPVMPIGVLITVVLTPCAITVAARLGRLLSGR